MLKFKTTRLKNVTKGKQTTACGLQAISVVQKRFDVGKVDASKLPCHWFLVSLPLPSCYPLDCSCFRSS